MKKGSKIRSYYLHPTQRVVDHRTGVECTDTYAVLDGELDRFIEANLLADLPQPHIKRHT